MAYTNATALLAAIALSEQAGDTELTAKLTRMHEVASKPSKKSDTMSKAQMLNLSLARKVAAFIWNSAPEMVASKLVVTSAGIPEITTTQKAVAVLGIARDNGWIVKTELKSKVYWQCGDVDPRV